MDEFTKHACKAGEVVKGDLMELAGRKMVVIDAASAIDYRIIVLEPLERHFDEELYASVVFHIDSPIHILK